jgi:hypothetical protein
MCQQVTEHNVVVKRLAYNREAPLYMSIYYHSYLMRETTRMCVSEWQTD